MRHTSDRVDPARDVSVWVEECWSAMVATARNQGWGEDTAEDIAQKAALKALDIARRDPERLKAVTGRRRWLCGNDVERGPVRPRQEE